MKCQAKLWPEQRAPKRSANPCKKRRQHREGEREKGRERERLIVNEGARECKGRQRGSTNLKSAEISWIFSMEQIVAPR